MPAQRAGGTTIAAQARRRRYRPATLK